MKSIKYVLLILAVVLLSACRNVGYGPQSSTATVSGTLTSGSGTSGSIISKAVTGNGATVNGIKFVAAIPANGGTPIVGELDSNGNFSIELNKSTSYVFKLMNEFGFPTKEISFGTVKDQSVGTFSDDLSLSTLTVGNSDQVLLTANLSNLVSQSKDEANVSDSTLGTSIINAVKQVLEDTGKGTVNASTGEVSITVAESGSAKQTMTLTLDSTGTVDTSVAVTITTTDGTITSEPVEIDLANLFTEVDLNDSSQVTTAVATIVSETAKKAKTTVEKVASGETTVADATNLTKSDAESAKNTAEENVSHQEDANDEQGSGTLTWKISSSFTGALKSLQATNADSTDLNDFYDALTAEKDASDTPTSIKNLLTALEAAKSIDKDSNTIDNLEVTIAKLLATYLLPTNIDKLTSIDYLSYDKIVELMDKLKDLALTYEDGDTSTSTFTKANLTTLINNVADNIADAETSYSKDIYIELEGSDILSKKAFLTKPHLSIIKGTYDIAASYVLYFINDIDGSRYTASEFMTSATIKAIYDGTPTAYSSSLTYLKAGVNKVKDNIGNSKLTNTNTNLLALSSSQITTLTSKVKTLKTGIDSIEE